MTNTEWALLEDCADELYRVVRLTDFPGNHPQVLEESYFLLSVIESKGIARNICGRMRRHLRRFYDHRGLYLSADAEISLGHQVIGLFAVAIRAAITTRRSAEEFASTLDDFEVTTVPRPRPPLAPELKPHAGELRTRFHA